MSAGPARQSGPGPAVAIVGAGVAGLSAALRFAQLGCRSVRVLERASVAAGSSGLAIGVYNCVGFDPAHAETRAQSRRLFDQWEKQSGLVLKRWGYLRLATQQSAVDLFREGVELHRRFGFDEADLVDPERIRELVPELRTEGIVGGLYSPEDGQVDGALLCSILADLAADLDVEIVKAELTGASRHGSGHRLQTSVGDFDADLVVNAAGPWAEAVGKLLGAELPIENQLHEVCKIKAPEGFGAGGPPVIQAYVPGQPAGVTICAERPGHLLASMHTYEVDASLKVEDPDNPRRSIPMEHLEQLAVEVDDWVPVPELGFEAGWTGMYPTSPDGAPIVGPYEADPSVIAIGGLGGYGITYGPSLGAAAAEWALDGEPHSVANATAFGPDRPSLRASHV